MQPDLRVHCKRSDLCSTFCTVWYVWATMHCVFVYYHAVFVFCCFFMSSMVLLSTMACIFTAQLQSMLLVLRVYYLCRVHIKALTRICICMVLTQFLIKKKPEHSLIYILAEIPFHLDHGKKLTNEDS